MARLAKQDHAFIRPTGLTLGEWRCGRERSHCLQAAGYDVVIIETVGVGQSEVGVSGMVDCFVTLMLLEQVMAQGIKKGLLELADVIVVNESVVKCHRGTAGSESL